MPVLVILPELTAISGLPILILVFVMIILGLWSVYANKKNKVLRKLKKTTIKKTALAKENEYIKVIGTLQTTTEPIISPIGKRECIGYQIKVEEKRKYKNNSWRTIMLEEKLLDFIIDSPQGKAFIVFPSDANNSLLYLVKNVVKKTGTWDNLPLFIEKSLTIHGKKSAGFLKSNKIFRYKESIIEAGNKMVVAGVCSLKPSMHKLDRYSSKDLFISGSKSHKLVITDTPKAQ
ncbi:hypothetical protein [Aquimarina pacifica]|uniref:hypothetical protein n=1 Tax=Aquimarina pacifica TaxID=1296415 RepID=UPI00046FC27C|nr:hypothetical protein [Aquimarina pacifica]